jgi:peptide/nickel transport system substrate-binding protein
VVAFGRVWAVSPSTGMVVSLAPGSGQILDQVTGVGVDPVAIADGDGAIWVANRDGGTVAKIAPRSPGQAQLADVVTIERGPISIASAPGGVWVANGAARTLTRIDPSGDEIDKTIALANPPQALAATDQGLYVAVRSSGEEHRGGTLRVHQAAPDSLDPALSYFDGAWRILAMTNDGLVGFRRVGGIEGVQLVPDLAVSLPTPSDSGLTYAFRLRRGVRYSTGRLVQPADFRTAIERAVGSPGAPLQARQYYLGIRGADRCRVGRPCSLSSGIVTKGHTVTFHLTKPDGDFLSKLALTFAFAVPAGTPAHAHTVPTTGPYKIASYREGRSLTLVRNRSFREWSPDAQPDGYPDKISFSFLSADATDSGAEVQSVEAGKADIAPNIGEPPLSKGQLLTLVRRHHSQLRLTPSPATEFFFLNTRVPPFDDVRVRRAVNEALDRRAYTKLLGPGSLPTCQVLPPDYPGYRKTCPYGPGGAAAYRAAKRLVRSAGRTGARVAVWMPPPGSTRGAFMVHVLNAIGLRAHLKTIDFKHYFDRIYDPGEHAQIGFNAWIADYPSETGFLPPIASCAVQNPSQFCDHAIDRLFARAEAAQVEHPGSASALWQKAERAVLAQAPAVPTLNPENVAFVAKRVGNFQYHPEWEVLLDQLWVH